MRNAEYPLPRLTLLHLSDTQVRGEGAPLFDLLDGTERLARALAVFEASRITPDAIIFTGDLADLGEPAAYAALRGLIDPFAERLGARVLWVMGNHDERGAFREGLLDEPSDLRPIDRVDDVDGLRVITLDTTVPGEHYGELGDEQLRWLRDELAMPAPLGSIVAMHHPPVPPVLPLAVSVELRDQSRLAEVLRGSDVRAIIAGHLHYSTFATFAGIPVSVASSTCYSQDLTVPAGGMRPQDGAQTFNLVHVFDDTIMHSVVPIDVPHTLEYIDPAEVRRRLDEAGVAPLSAPAVDAPSRPAPPRR